MTAGHVIFDLIFPDSQRSLKSDIHIDGKGIPAKGTRILKINNAPMRKGSNTGTNR